ncbi:MAG: hypothetical protein Q9218_006549 [Villophora microphyllina]
MTRQIRYSSLALAFFYQLFSRAQPITATSHLPDEFQRRLTALRQHSAAELRSKCFQALAYIAVGVAWLFLVWDWTVKPVIKLYPIVATTLSPVLRTTSRGYREYLDRHLRDVLRLVLQAIEHNARTIAGALRLQRNETDKDFDAGSSATLQGSTLQGSTMGDDGDYVCPWNDSRIFVESESSPSWSSGPEDSATSEEVAPSSQCQALILYPRLHVKILGSQMLTQEPKTPVRSVKPRPAFLTEPEPTATNTKPPPTFRDSITLRKKQLVQGASDEYHAHVIRRKPKIKQFKDPPSPPPTPTLEAYTTTPGIYSKELEQTFGEEVFHGSGSPNARRSRVMGMAERSVSASKVAPPSAASSPVVIDATPPLTPLSEDDLTDGNNCLISID